MQRDVAALARFELFSLGGVSVSVGALVTAAAVAAAFFLASRIIGLAIRNVRGRARHGRAALYLVEKLVTYALVLFGAAIALSTLGLNLSSIAVFAGGLGVGLGLGLQGVVKEFVSGLVLIFDRSVNLGDYVELEGGARGVVQEIGPRATRIRNNDNVDFLVPNSHIIETALTNWTLRDETRRIHVPFNVAYGADKEKVREAVIAAAKRVPFTLPDTDSRRSQVWLVGFGESALNFELLVWPALDAVKRPRAMHAAYTWAIDDALRQAGIEIPYPQRDVRVRALFGEEGEDALKALKLDRQSAPAPAAVATTNDAARDLLTSKLPEPPPEPES